MTDPNPESVGDFIKRAYEPGTYADTDEDDLHQLIVEAFRRAAENDSMSD